MDGPVHQILDYLSGKWKLKILMILMMESPCRFGKIAAALPEASPKILSQRLREFEEAGLVNRMVYAEMPPRVEYALSETGNQLAMCVVQIKHVAENMNWLNTDKCCHCGVCDSFSEKVSCQNCLKDKKNA